MKEEWKDIPGYENYYMVSNFGNIKRLKVLITEKNSNKKYYTSEKILKPFINKRGYKTITLCKNGVSKKFKVHHLVIENFSNDRPKNMVCCHNDGDPSNNNIMNLRWDTQKNNCIDTILHGKSVKGIKNGMSKLKDAEVYIIKKLLKNNIRQNLIAKMFKLDCSNISKIKNGNSWNHVLLEE